ncbi:penicillin-binding protein 1C [candidate division KSB1 bacterium]|nr:penicillin-binding protein 1C [candidate division KSB1 bacterium]
MIIGYISIIVFFIFIWLVPFPTEKLTPPPSTIVLDRNGELLRVFLSKNDMWQIPVSSDKISPRLKLAVTGYEDQYFRWHFGINPIALIRAAIINLKSGRIKQGGSTITMQVARMMEPKERTIPNKLIEIFRALQLELRYPKDEILDFYLNLAPYGGNIVGVGAASHLYFRKSPDQLSLGECALLATIPNSPNLFRPDVDFQATINAREKVLKILFARKKINRQQYEEALAEPISDRRIEVPFKIPHLSTKLAQLFPQKITLETTIDAKIQQRAESILQTHLRPLRNQGITNGAVVVVENETRNVLAIVGSYDFFDEKNQGQVNGAMAPRSPGSALKPFIYALGIEQGLIAPQSLLYDVPIEYSGYKPINYDEMYHGVVTVEEALIRSLNIPAVNLYAQLGNDGIHSFLNEAGISTLPKPREYYGLSLILGGCEVTLLELTNLYAGIANGGNFHSYRWLKDQPEQEGKSLLSEGTCFIISEMLSQLRRPELPSSWEYAMNLPKIAWKTGTSYGHRDAWSIGYTPQYTIGVWTGNFDGKGAPGLIGAEVAAPILFALFTALEKPSENKWFIQPGSVSRRQVCAVSGMPMSKYCATAKEELYLPGKSPIEKCNIHQMIFVDKKTGNRLCSHCRIGRSYDEKIVEQWPAEIATWMERNGYPIEKIPEHFQGCSKLVSGDKPIIRSPSTNTEFKIRPAVALKYQKILLDASVSNRTQKIFWFLDGKLIFSGVATEKIFIEPKIGSHNLICMDDEGRASEVKIVVK